MSDPNVVKLLELVLDRTPIGDEIHKLAATMRESYIPEGAEAIRRRKIVEAAREALQEDGVVEIDDGARISEGNDNGCYVESWSWFSFEGTEFETFEDEDDDTEPVAASVVLVGNPVDGVKAYGPFTDPEGVDAQASTLRNEEWWNAPLKLPPPIERTTITWGRIHDRLSNVLEDPERDNHHLRARVLLRRYLAFSYVLPDIKLWGSSGQVRFTGNPVSGHQLEGPYPSRREGHDGAETAIVPPDGFFRKLNDWARMNLDLRAMLNINEPEVDKEGFFKLASDYLEHMRGYVPLQNDDEVTHDLANHYRSAEP